MAKKTPNTKSSNAKRPSRNLIFMEQPPFVCDICTAPLRTVTDLRQHRRVKHRATTPIFKCPYTELCSKTDRRAGNMQAHVNTHSRKFLFACPYEHCGKRYTSTRSCSRHMLRSHKIKGKTLKPQQIENPDRIQPTVTPGSRTNPALVASPYSAKSTTPSSMTSSPSSSPPQTPPGDIRLVFSSAQAVEPSSAIPGASQSQSGSAAFSQQWLPYPVNYVPVYMPPSTSMYTTPGIALTEANRLPLSSGHPPMQHPLEGGVSATSPHGLTTDSSLGACGNLQYPYILQTNPAVDIFGSVNFNVGGVPPELQQPFPPSNPPPAAPVQPYYHLNGLRNQIPHAHTRVAPTSGFNNPWFPTSQPSSFTPQPPGLPQTSLHYGPNSTANSGGIGLQGPQEPEIGLEDIEVLQAMGLLPRQYSF